MFNGTASKLKSVFLVGFFLTIALSLTGYVDSSFAEKYVNLKTVGILFSLGSTAAIAYLAYLPKILGRLGTTKTFHLTAIVYLLSVLGMLYTGTPIIFKILFIVYLATGIGIYFVIDILIEHFSRSKTTGNIRGVSLVIYNIAYLIGPLLAGIILKSNSFKLVYLLAGIFIIIMILVYARDLEKISFHSHHNGKSLWRNFLRLSKNIELLQGYLVALALAFFFSWMAIYTPIYLREFMSFGWDKIGAIFAIMHIPYIILDLPIGRFLDKCSCEREFITLGFVIVGISTMSLALIGFPSFTLWAIGLGLTRVGASFIQVGSESYFFKRVTDKDSDMIAAFRNATPVAYILGPLVATLFLSFSSYKGLFVILGLIMLVCTLLSLSLRNHYGSKHLSHTH